MLQLLFSQGLQEHSNSHLTFCIMSIELRMSHARIFKILFMLLLFMDIFAGLPHKEIHLKSLFFCL